MKRACQLEVYEFWLLVFTDLPLYTTDRKKWDGSAVAGYTHNSK